MMRRLDARELRDVRTLDRVQPADASEPASARLDRLRLRVLLEDELARTPARIATVVAEALAGFHDAAEVCVHLHPRDRARMPCAAQLREAHALRGALTFVDDAALRPGGCLVTAAHGTLDARLETQVALLLAAAEVPA